MTSQIAGIDILHVLVNENTYMKTAQNRVFPPMQNNNIYIFKYIYIKNNIYINIYILIYILWIICIYYRKYIYIIHNIYIFFNNIYINIYMNEVI